MCRKAFGQFVQPLTGVARDRDDGLGAHPRELADQVRPDVAGRTDNELSGISVQRHRRLRWHRTPLQPGHVTHTPPVDDLVFTVAAVDFTQHLGRRQFGGHRAVQIDDPAPDFGVLQRECASQAPQRPVGGVGVIAFGDGLGVAGDDEQLGRRGAGSHRGDQAPYPMEQLVRHSRIDGLACRRRVDHMVDTAQRRA